MPRPYGVLLAAGVCLIALTGLSFSPIIMSAALAQEAASADTAAAADDTPAPLSEDELEVLVARIALYPDELVAVISSASLYPLQVIEAARYLDDLKKDAKLKPKASWDGSIVSLLNYPDIVKMMSEDLDWTQSLGGALSYQQKDVLIAIQQLRDKAVANGIIKSDDKIKVSEENDKVVIVSANPEKVYVPQYAPEMLYEPGYAAAPISYYPDPYPNYYYPTATFFAGAVTGAIWASVVDWDDWGVWGGRWKGDVDIDCNQCFNNINGRVNINDVDWKNVDRSKIKFDKNQFNKLDNTSFRNSIKADGRNDLKAKANVIGNDRAANIRNKPGNISVKDVRNSKIDADRINRDKIGNPAGNRPGQAVQNRKPDGGKLNKPAGDIKNKANFDRPVSRPKPAARADNRAAKPSALGQVDNGRRTQMQSDRGRQAMGGGNRGGGGHRQMPRGGGRHR